MESSDTETRINTFALYSPSLNPRWPKSHPLTPAESQCEEPHIKHPGTPPDKRCKKAVKKPVKKPTKKAIQKPTGRKTNNTIAEAQDASDFESNLVISSFRLTQNETLFLLDLINSAKQDHPAPNERDPNDDEVWASYISLMNHVSFLGE